VALLLRNETKQEAALANYNQFLPGIFDKVSIRLHFNVQYGDYLLYFLDYMLRLWIRWCDMGPSV